MDLQAVQNAVEQACTLLHSPQHRQQAEATLLDLRQSPEALRICQYVLQHSTNLMARFQAAAALREAAVRQWPALSPEDKVALRRFLLQQILGASTDGSEQVLLGALVSAVATIVKRGWLEEEGRWRTACMEDLNAGLANDPKTLAMQLRVIESIILEFAPDTASTMAMAWDFHEKCKASLQDGYLKQFFQHALSAAAGALGAGDQGTMQSALGVMNAALNWDFRGPSMGGRWGSQRFRGGNDTLHVRPGAAWSDILLSDAPATLLQTLLPQLRGAQATSPLATAARHLLVLLCGLDGDIFPREDTEARTALGLSPGTAGAPLGTRETYLARLLPLVVAYGTPPQQAVQGALQGDPGELLDCCRCINVAAECYSFTAFHNASAAVATLQPGGFFVWLAGLTCALLDARFSAGHDEGAVHTMVEFMLEAWVSLIEPGRRVSIIDPRGTAPNIPEDAARCCGTIVEALVVAGLKDAAAGAHQDADDEAEHGAGAAQAEEWMTRMSSLGRVAPEYTLALLSQQLDQHQKLLLETAQRHGDVAVPLEQLCWLMQLSGYIIADPGAGETPLAPLPIVQLSEHISAAGCASDADPVVSISYCLLETAKLPLNPQLRALISPRLMEACLWSVARWAATYLCPEEALPRTLEGAFGGPGRGPQVVDVLVQVANECLLSFPGEVALHRVVSTDLLSALVRHKDICKVLVGPPPNTHWAALARAVSEQVPTILALSPETQLSLMQQLVSASKGLGDQHTANEYVVQLVQGPLTQLQQLSSTPDLKSRAQEAATMHRVTCLLDTLRGACKGALPSTGAAQLHLLQSSMQPLLQLQGVYHQHAHMTGLIFRYAADAIEALLAQLSQADAKVLIQWALAMLQQYADRRKDVTSLQVASTAQAAEAQEELREELESVLQMLIHLVQRDVASTADSNGIEGHAHLAANGAVADSGADLAQATLLGLDAVVPVLTPELLAAPNLCNTFFALLGYLTEIYPENLSRLSGPSFQRVEQLLAYGLKHPDQTVLQQTLEAVSALAGWHCTMNAGGTTPQAGLGAHNAAGPDGRTALGRMLELCLDRVLFDPNVEPMEALADALLPLMLSERNTYAAIGTALLARQPDASLRQVLEQALQKLMVLQTDGQIAVDRKTKRVFRGNLLEFAAHARSVVCVQ